MKFEIFQELEVDPEQDIVIELIDPEDFDCSWHSIPGDDIEVSQSNGTLWIGGYATPFETGIS